jgi:NADH-quinone oxidoreductase subunit G
MPTVIVNGQEIEIGDQERLNGIQVAQRAGVDVPHYCWHPGLSVVASCRMCLVESGAKNSETGEISMIPKLVPACQTPAKDGTVFVTDSEKVRQARAMVEEDLLIDHPIDCPICDKAGECYLQDYHFKYGQKERRADIRPFTSRRRSLGDTVTLFVDRCVMCSRCVRFAREVSGTSELMVVNRGSHEEIDVFPGFPLDNKLSGNVVDLCPVGALGDKDFLYSQRVWYMKSHPHVCAGCSTGCSIHVDENHDQLYRLRPRENPAVNQWWICDEGRYGFKHVHDEHRITTPQRKSDDGYETVEWSDLNIELDRKLRAAGRLAVALSPHLTVEEAYLLATYIRRLDGQALVAVGPTPTVGEDETFPGGFTIRAEKCPNRRGVEEIAAHVMRRASHWNDIIAAAQAGELGGVWISGGYKTDWVDEPTAETLGRVALVVVQDLFASPLSKKADYLLPAAAFAEREGSFVNHADRLQSFRWAIRAPAGVKVEGRMLWELLKRPGMYNARDVLTEIARATTFFATATAEVPPIGLDLHARQLAENR